MSGKRAKCIRREVYGCDLAPLARQYVQPKKRSKWDYTIVNAPDSLRARYLCAKRTHKARAAGMEGV